jgi:hypothetical protein
MTWTLVGLKGTGKTNCATLLMSEAVKRGYIVFTNIHFFTYEQIPTAINRGMLTMRHDGKQYFKKPDEIVVCSKLSTLLMGLCDGVNAVTILDEAGISADSSRGTSKSTTTIKDINKIIRHFNSCFGLITQVRESMAPDLRERGNDCELNVVRLQNGGRMLECGKRDEYRDDAGEKHIYFPVIDRFGPLPLAQYPFDSNFPSGFEIDIDLKVALDKLSQFHSSLDIIGKDGAGRKVIEQMLLSPTKKTKKKKVT